MATSVEKIEELYDKAFLWDLYGVETLLKVGFPTVAAEYNGIGPEWAPDGARELVTEKFPELEPSACLHDLDYKLGDRSVKKFHEANLRLKRNIEQTASALYTPIISWKWWKLQLIAQTFYKACERFGWVAYLNACS